MPTHQSSSRRDPRERGDDEIEFLSDIALTALAGSTRLAPERRAFIGQHVNHPCHAGWTLILGWARDVLDEDQLDILLEASRRPRRPHAMVSIDAGTAKSRRWKAAKAEFDAAAKADARLSRKIRIGAEERFAREYNREFPTWAGLGIAIGLALLGFFLVGILGQESRLEDCLLQGRHNCSAIPEGGPLSPGTSGALMPPQTRSAASSRTRDPASAAD